MTPAFSNLERKIVCAVRFSEALTTEHDSYFLFLIVPKPVTLMFLLSYLFLVGVHCVYIYRAITYLTPGTIQMHETTLPWPVRTPLVPPGLQCSKQPHLSRHVRT